MDGCKAQASIFTGTAPMDAVIMSQIPTFLPTYVPVATKNEVYEHELTHSCHHKSDLVSAPLLCTGIPIAST